MGNCSLIAVDTFTATVYVSILSTGMSLADFFSRISLAFLAADLPILAGSDTTPRSAPSFTEEMLSANKGSSPVASFTFVTKPFDSASGPDESQ